MDEQFVLEQVVVHRRKPFQFVFATRAIQALPEHEDYAPIGPDDGQRAA
jgi:hypothetical protein